MSLDVWLHRKRAELPEAAKAAALLRVNGFEEFATELAFRHDTSEYDTLFDANVTHNLNKMAEEAGIYQACWRPEELGITKASDLIPLLQSGLDKLQNDRPRFEKFNPSNGWGSYEGFVSWVAKYLEACREYPDAEVSVSR